MELSSTLQLERLSLGGSPESSPSPSPSPSSAQSPTCIFPLFSLPHELAEMILETVSSQSAGRERNLDLARLSRVNKVIQAIIVTRREGQYVGHRTRAQAIHPDSQDFLREALGELDDLDLDKLFRSLNNLHTIRTRWNPTSVSPPANSPILKVVVNSQPQLLRLELPHVNLSMRDIKLIASSLPRLETLVVNLPNLKTIAEFNPVFRLSRLVALELPDPRILFPLLISLTSNSDLPSLATFTQLRSLSLWISTPKRSTHNLLNDEADRVMIARMRKVLVSVKEVEIKILKIGSPLSLQLYDIHETIFANLPRSIESFTFGPKNDETIDWRSLLPSKTSSPYPFLKHISMTRLPRSIRRSPGLPKGAQGNLKQLCIEARIKLELQPVTHLHRFNAFILDSPRVIGGEYDAESAPDFKLVGMHTDRGYVPLPYGWP